MLNGLYTILFAMSFIMLVILVSQFKDRISVYYVLLYATILVANLGYLQITDAQNAMMGIFSNQIVYLGASFSPFFMLMCLSDLCKVKIHRSWRVFFITYSVFIFILTSTVGVFPVYYKSVSIIRKNGVSYLDKVYGPLHTLYPAYLIIIFVVALSIVIYAFRKKKDVSYITCTGVLVVLLVMISVYVVEKLMHLQVELLPIAYVIGQIVVLMLLRRISLYDVSAITADSMVESMAYGFVIFDSKGRYLGGDEAAKVWFPELKELHIDRMNDKKDSAFLMQMEKWVRRQEANDTMQFRCNDVIVEAQHTILNEKRNKSVHCVYLRDNTKQQKYTELVEQYNENLERDVNAKTEKIRHIQDDIIISMASIVENRDNNTGGHIARTSDVVKIFVNHLQEKDGFENLTPEVARCIIKAAPLHDFGKIAIPDVILNKPGKFTDEEYEEMKKHSAKGAVIVERILQNAEDTLFKNIAVNVAHYHHEKWNGMGYPEGIKEEEIPFEARVMALADVFDALVSKRVYKERFDYDKAFAIIEESGGSHFDPELCKAFLECRDKFEDLYNSYDD